MSLFGKKVTSPFGCCRPLGYTSVVVPKPSLMRQGSRLVVGGTGNTVFSSIPIRQGARFDLVGPPVMGTNAFRQGARLVGEGTGNTTYQPGTTLSPDAVYRGRSVSAGHGGMGGFGGYGSFGSDPGTARPGAGNIDVNTGKDLSGKTGVNTGKALNLIGSIWDKLAGKLDAQAQAKADALAAANAGGAYTPPAAADSGMAGWVAPVGGLVALAAIGFALYEFVLKAPQSAPSASPAAVAARANRRKAHKQARKNGKRRGKSKMRWGIPKRKNIMSGDVLAAGSSFGGLSFGK